MKYQLWQQDPVQVWGVETHEDEPFDWLAEPFLNLLHANEGGINMRGVAIGRLPTILTRGIDVEPTDGPIYCEMGDKAYEYGGFPKVIMALRYWCAAGSQVMFPAFRTVYSHSSPESVAEAHELYPFEVGRDEDMEHRYRVQPDSEATRNYLGAYGYFVPDDPWQALAAVFVFGTREQLSEARALAEAFNVPRVTVPQS